MSNEVEQWKSKYQTLLTKSEQEAVSTTEHLALLQRALVRSILAAEGQDSVLDKALKQLRAAARKDATTLEQVVAEFENNLIKSDERKSNRLKQIQNSLQELTNQLLLCDPPANTERSLNKYQAALSVSLQDLQNIHQLLSELTELQAGALKTPTAEASTQLAESATKPSFLNRLFSKQAEPEKLSEPEIHSKTEQASEPEQQLIDCDGHSIDIVISQISNTLNNLLSNLPTDKNNQSDISQLKLQIEQGLSCADLPAVIAKVSFLVINLQSSSQADIGSYLLQLSQRLGQVNQSLQTTQSSYSQAIEVAKSFDNQLHSQVGQIQSDVKTSTDLEQLKITVDDKLNQFMHTLTNYQQQRQEVENTVVQRFNALHERVNQMESEAQQLNTQLEEQQKQARQDPLTALPNRAAWDERLNIEHTRLQRSQNPLVMAIIDIDFFKHINDNYGHIAGDKVLKIIASTLQGSIRKTDFIARYGGEEFTILLTNTDLDKATVLLNNIREKVAATKFHFKGEPVQITFSAGVGQLSAQEPTEQAFSRIDQALYQAKNSGRNNVMPA